LVRVRAVLGWLISGMLAGITYVYPEEIRTLIDSIMPNAGYYIVRIVFFFALAYFLVTAVYEAYKWIWKKEATRPELHLRPNLLNKLETLHAKLTDDPVTAIYWFESDIERKGYLKALQDLSPELVASFTEMRKLVKELEDAPITEKEAREQLGDKEYERQRSFRSVDKIHLWFDRMRDSPELQEIVNKLKMQIQNLISKSN